MPITLVDLSDTLVNPRDTLEALDTLESLNSLKRLILTDKQASRPVTKPCIGPTFGRAKITLFLYLYGKS